MGPIEMVRAEMAKAGLDSLLVTDIGNIGWLTGFSGSNGRVLLTKDQARFLTDSRYTVQAAEEVKEMPTASFANPVNFDDFTAQHARELGITRIGFEANTVPYAAWQQLGAKLPGIELVPAPDLFTGLRMVKTAQEIEAVRRACGLADAAFDYIRGRVRPGISEFDLNLDLEFFIRRQGADLAFPPIVVSGERSARPHGHASEKIMEPGDFLTMDFGACIGGYNSDITRTVVISNATDRHREVYGAVLEAQLASLEAMKPDVRAADVDRVARDVLAKHGLAEHFGHGLGHGLGKAVHDAGRMSPTSTDVLAPGQIWTVEPGVYIPGFGGVRIEDDVVVTADGIEILTHSTKELLVLGS